ncbi:catalase-like [Sphaeramia orbicularis]|uniref:catalase-like n=1 Tax=Sphaeramia orbicularis TaxID=375764 RepID=UPI00117E63BC|nr:catalase-like [Sphaeramia orbicularis]
MRRKVYHPDFRSEQEEANHLGAKRLMTCGPHSFNAGTPAVHAFYTQVLNEEERQRLCQNMAGALKGAQLFIQKRMVEQLKTVHADYGNKVQTYLNKYNTEPKKNTVHVYSRPGAIPASSKM